MTSQHYTVDPEWQSSERARIGNLRSIDAGRSKAACSFNASALATALSLTAKPVFPGTARKVAGLWGVDKD